MTTLMRLLQFTDSAFPVGAFSFSNGLETAAHEGIVHNASTLEKYTQSIMLQTAYSDGIAALQAFRATNKKDYNNILEADRQLFQFKMNEEARIMLQKMGKKFIELSIHLFDIPILHQWLEDIKTGITPGTYPITQAIVFSIADLSEKELFCSHQYGVINMILNASLRCVKVSHYDTQRILFKLSEQMNNLYEDIRLLTFKDMNAFTPQADIFASLHEKGNMRMFMN